MEKLVDQLEATSEDGETRILYVFQQIIDAGTFGDPHATILGLSRVEDEYGNAVNVLEDGLYEIVAIGLKVKGRPIRDTP